MTTRSPTLAETIRDAIDVRLSNIHTSIPARVESYDSTTQRANVKPVVNRTDVIGGEEITQEFPVLMNVPVAFPRAGGWAITMPLAPGDYVLVTFSERSLDGWRSTGAVPSDDLLARSHDLSDAVAHPISVYPDASPIASVAPDHMVIGREDTGTRVLIKPDGYVEVVTAGGLPVHAAISEHLAALWALLKAELDLKFNSHTHTVPDAIPLSGSVPPTTLPPSVSLPPTILSTPAYDGTIQSNKLTFPDG